MGVDRWGRAEVPDRGTAGDKPNEQGAEGALEDPRARDTWVDPRSWLSAEDRLKYYRRHEPMSEQELARLEADQGEDSNRYTFDRDEDFGRVEEVGQREDAGRDGGTAESPSSSDAARDEVQENGNEPVEGADDSGGAEGGGGPPGLQNAGSADFDGERDEETAGEGETGEELTLAEGQEGDAEPSEASGHVVQSSDEQDDRLGEWSGVTATVEDGRVRVHDPLRPDVWNPERGEAKDQSDRLGDRIVNEENEEQSRLERLRRAGWKNSEDLLDGVKEHTDQAYSALTERADPTAYTVIRSEPVVMENRRDAVEAGDIVVATALTVALLAEGVFAARRASAARKGDT